MEIAIILKSIILGLIEGLTEFIPVSSTAHILLANKVLHFSKVRNGIFETSIQLGAVLAICLFYFHKLLRVAVTFFKNKSSRHFIYNLLLAFIPSAIIGLLFYKTVKQLFFSLHHIALALIVGGIVILIVEKLNIKSRVREVEKISKTKALFIGLFQIIAMIPGVSRSGATIIGGLLLRLDRKAAVEFSFLLAIPTILAASAFDLFKNRHLLTASNLEIISIGAISAFVTSLFVIRFLILFISNHSLKIFAYYRIVLGILILIIPTFLH